MAKRTDANVTSALLRPQAKSSTSAAYRDEVTSFGTDPAKMIMLVQ